MELALNAATIAISRSGASSLAEFAALRLPSILIPFPAATDNHQFHNARALVETGAARMLGEERSTTDNLTRMVVELMTNAAERRRLASALADWHRPNAARDIAEAILKKIPGFREQRAASVPLMTDEEQGNPNSEFRIPKEIRSPKSEAEQPSWPEAVRVSDFGLLSEFGIRNSDFTTT